MAPRNGGCWRLHRPAHTYLPQSGSKRILFSTQPVSPSGLPSDGAPPLSECVMSAAGVRRSLAGALASAVLVLATSESDNRHCDP